MPLQKLQFRPGVNREGTNYSNEGGFYECDKIRFRSGYPEKLGGWQSISPYTYVGTNRNMWNWVTLDGANLNAVGTSQKLYVEYGGLYNDITPIRQTTTTLGAPTGPFTTTNGSPLVEVTHTSHGAAVNSFVSFSGASAVGGLTISGEYEIVAVPSANTYNIIAASNATSSATGGGATVTATYYLNTGLSTSVSGTGWGAGGWSRGGWGSGTAVSVSNQLALWSLDNYGEDMVCCQRGGTIYYWDTNTVTFPRATALSDVANSTVLYTTTATSGGAGTTITVTSASGLGPGMVVSGTNVVAGTYITTAYTPGSTTVTLSASTTGAASGSYTFSYAGRFIPNATYQILTSDIQRFAICFGANPYDPTNFTPIFDPMLVRWSDQENIYQWVPAVTNQAGEQRLSNGSGIVTARHTGQETLIWTDSAIFSMQYIGPPYVFGFSMLADNISVMSPNCTAVANNITYWMGIDKFYTYAGRVETLPCSLRQYVFQNLNKNQAYQIVCGTNEAYNEIWWFYPSLNSPTNDSYVIYNYLERIWYYGSLRRTAWLDSPLRSYPMAAFSVQNTYLASNITSTDTQIPVLNSSAYPSTGTIRIGSEKITYTSVNANAFYGCTRGVEGTTAASHNAYAAVTYTIANQVMYHEVGVDDASTDMPTAIEAFIQSSDFDIGDGHNFGFVWRMIPDLTFSGSTTTNPTATLTVRPRQFSGSNYGVANDPSVTRTATYPVEQYTGQVYTRLRGRQMAFKISSSGLGVTWQLGTPRIDIRNDGKR